LFYKWKIKNKDKTMETVFTIAVGIVIGIVDAVPMLVKKMDEADCLSAFIQYVVATFIIFNTTLPQLNVSYVFVGPIVSFLMALPIVIIVGKKEKKAVPIILANAIVLGFAISVIKHLSAPLFM